MLTDAERSGYLMFLKEERCNSDATIRRAISTLRAFYRFGRSSIPLHHQSDVSFVFKNRGTSSTLGGNSITPRRVKSNYIDRLLFDVIEAHVEGASSFTRLRNLIGIRLGRNSGLRAHEVTLPGNFDTRKLRSLIAEMHVRGETALEVYILSRKGQKGRSIVIRKRDVALIERFLTGPRSKRPEGDLLCRDDGLSFAIGSTPASGWFRSALVAAMPVLLQKYQDFCRNPSRKFIVAKDALGSLGFHSGRHSYATDLVSEAYEAGTDPKHLLLLRLGHQKPTTLSAYITVEATACGRDIGRANFDIAEGVI